MATLKVQWQRRDWDSEQVGRTLLEYGGIPLAFFMAAGITINFLQGYGMYHTFVDPTKNFYLYFVLNVWLVALIYFYRQRYQTQFLFADRIEIGLAGFAAFTWILSQPILLLAGYAFYMNAVLRHDRLHGSFLPDLTDIAEKADESEAWGYLEDMDDHVT